MSGKTGSLLLFVVSLAGCGSSPIAADAAVIDAEVIDAASDDAAGAPAPTATTTFGPVIGTRMGGVAAFLGIPYAAPPVGDLRWRPPSPPIPWTVPLESRRPSACPQFVSGLRLGREDCLYVNVHRPDPMPDHAPVMVWIHGGGFTLGEGVQTDGGTVGDVLARETGVVVVSMNYRLGFLAHAALDGESADHVSGNYGFLDQVAALEWVRDNAAAFGGDPANVTIFGESAGGVSVCGHLIARESRGLFHQAIIESGPCAGTRMTLTAAEAQGARFATLLGCTSGDVPACMRAATESAVLEALAPSPAIVGTGPDFGSWGPIIDGHVFSVPWMQAIAAGDVADVPVIAGWNRDEGTIFIVLMEASGSPPITAANYRDSVLSFTGAAHADAIVARYPPSNFGGDARLAAARALGDGGLLCPSRATAIALGAHVPVRSYLFTYPDARFLLGASFPLGAFHMAEVQFVFGHPVGRVYPADGEALHHEMAGYWTRFASNHGDPNGAGAVAWPLFDVSLIRLGLDRTVAVSADDLGATCEFWRGITYE